MLLHKQIFACSVIAGEPQANTSYSDRSGWSCAAMSCTWPFLPCQPSGTGQYGGEAGVFQTACQPLCFFEGIQIILMTRAPVEMGSAAAVLADKVEQDAADGGVACVGCRQDDGFAAVFLQGKRTERAFNADDAFSLTLGSLPKIISEQTPFSRLRMCSSKMPSWSGELAME